MITFRGWGVCMASDKGKRSLLQLSDGRVRDVSEGCVQSGSITPGRRPVSTAGVEDLISRKSE